MSTAEDGSADYAAAWNALPRRDRAELTQAAMRGVRPDNRWDAAITLWWAQRELKLGLRRDVAFAVVVAAVVVLFTWAATGRFPTSLGQVITTNPLLPVLLLIPLAASSLRRPRLRRSAQLNAAVLAGKRFDGPPDPEEAERLLARARNKGWFRGTRPKHDPGS